MNFFFVAGNKSLQPIISTPSSGNHCRDRPGLDFEERGMQLLRRTAKLGRKLSSGQSPFGKNGLVGAEARSGRSGEGPEKVERAIVRPTASFSRLVPITPPITLYLRERLFRFTR